MNLPNKIFLTGMPGSGKSTLGKKLAPRLDIPFLDLDKVIVQAEGMTIPEIFSSKGEDHFRALEKKYLHKIIEENDRFLLATGGGAPCFFDNIDVMNSSGYVIFLNHSIEHIVSRVIRKKAKRPLVAKMDDAEIQQDIEAMYKKRLPFYKKAHLVLDPRSIDVDAAMDKLYIQ
ncbi:MAG: shikimate kinase [Cyclobacteriaceae bacterium]